MDNSINFKVIDCENYVYIADNYHYSSLGLENFLFDGVHPEKTHKNKWFRISKIPKTVQKKMDKKRINKHYELKAGYPPSELMPSVLEIDQYQSDEFEDVRGLYTYKYDEIEAGYENVDFTIEVIYKRKDFEFIPNIFHAEVSLITQIEYPEEAYQDMPCRLNSSQMFNIIRDYVKRHIDSNVAKITADYNFHFEVKKSIALYNPYTIKVDVNNSFMNKRRKPKWVDRMVSTKEESILNIKDKSSSSDYGDTCVVAPSFTGENYKDLQDKVTKYLEELIEQINKKYCECPTCKGWGVVEVEDEKEI